MDKHIHLASVEALRLIKSKLREITVEEAMGLELLGQPFGSNLEHCIFLGLKYCPNFENKVRYYVERKELSSEDYRNQVRLMAHTLPHQIVFIDFYGERKHST